MRHIGVTPRTKTNVRIYEEGRSAGELVHQGTATAPTSGPSPAARIRQLFQDLRGRL